MTSLIGKRRLIAGVALWAFSAVAHAGPTGPVTACISDTQTATGVNLAQALAAGGVIQFQCPTGSTIRITRTYVLKTDTFIEGGGGVTFDGHGLPGPMLTALQSLVVRNIKVRNFTAKVNSPLPPFAKTVGRLNGSLINGFKDVELDNASIETSTFPLDALGIVTILDSSFVGNVGGLVLHVGGAAHIERSTFKGNTGGVMFTEGWLRDSVFDGQIGGALSVDGARKSIEIRHCTFAGTRGKAALSFSQRAAGGRSAQTITIRDNAFIDNDGGLTAGGIDIFDSVQEARNRGASASVLRLLANTPPTLFLLRYNRFTANRGARGGAISASLANSQGINSVGDLFMNNSTSGDGGAVSVSSGSILISHSLFKGNHAEGRGAALAAAPGASISLSNALVVGNTGPTGTIAGNAVSLINVTVADNNAVGLMLGTRSSQGANLLLARNRPSDCLGVPVGVFVGGGMQSDGSCPGVPVGEAFLDTMYVPMAGSPALRDGDPSFCHGGMVGSVDLPFQARPLSMSCALGAYEGPPVTKFAPKSDVAVIHADPSDNFSDNESEQPSSPGNGVPVYTSPDYPPAQQPNPAYHTDSPYPDTARYPPSQSKSAYPASPTSEPKSNQASAVPGLISPLAKGPLKTVLAALSAESATPAEQVHTFMVRGAAMDVYFMARIGARRFHLRINPRQSGPELVIVEGLQWARASSRTPWRNAPAQNNLGPTPSMANLFEFGLANAVEHVIQSGSRRVSGSISWTNGESCEGKLNLTISKAGLPVILRFEGTCGSTPVQFHQNFSHSRVVQIEPPI